MNISTPETNPRKKTWWSWLDAWATEEPDPEKLDDRIEPLSFIPLLFIHVMCLGVLWTGVSLTAVIVALALYLLRMFFITGFYHRYFSHSTFKTSRPFQFLMGAAGCTAAQRGPLWWAAHHRHHHAHADGPEDRHSPRQLGFFRSHIGWIVTRKNYPTARRYVKDWVRFPELVFLERFPWIMPLALATGLFLLGQGLATWAPGLGTDGWQLLFWGFFVSTTAVYHGTFTINSLAHLMGRRRFSTKDDSRNSFLLSLITLGEGWHNNHHYYPSTVRQGFYWWEIDITYYLLLLLSKLGLIWKLKPVPARVLNRNS
jgi:stearoyl-CoA desaturase (Delta-9 desaturase)